MFIINFLNGYLVMGVLANGNHVKWGLNNNILKIIAMVTMFIDHLGLMFFPNLLILRIIGRLSFPIFAYMIAEGCTHTKNRLNYLLSVGILGLLCQLVYFIADGSLYLGVLITFTLSISVIFAVDYFIKKRNATSTLILVLTVGVTVFLSVIAPLLFEKYGYLLDYGFLGVLLPVAIYFSKNKWLKLAFACIVLIAMAFVIAKIQFWALLSIPLLALYNGKRGKLKLKYMFYIFYPLHLALLQGLSWLIF